MENQINAAEKVKKEKEMDLHLSSEDTLVLNEITTNENQTLVQVYLQVVAAPQTNKITVL